MPENNFSSGSTRDVISFDWFPELNYVRRFDDLIGCFTHPAESDGPLPCTAPHFGVFVVDKDQH